MEKTSITHTFNFHGGKKRYPESSHRVVVYREAHLSLKKMRLTYWKLTTLFNESHDNDRTYPQTNGEALDGIFPGILDPHR